MNTDVLFSKASDNWTTPDDFYAKLHEEFQFQIDAAATEETTKCDEWFEDALKVDWAGVARGGSIFVNPPYSQCRAFMQKAAEEAQKGATVVCLVPARVDTRWWFDHVWDEMTQQPKPGVEVRFVKGRLKFGGSTNSAPFPSVVIVMRPPNTDRLF